MCARTHTCVLVCVCVCMCTHLYAYAHMCACAMEYMWIEVDNMPESALSFCHVGPGNWTQVSTFIPQPVSLARSFPLWCPVLMLYGYCSESKVLLELLLPTYFLHKVIYAETQYPKPNCKSLKYLLQEQRGEKPMRQSLQPPCICFLPSASSGLLTGSSLGFHIALDFYTVCKV